MPFVAVHIDDLIVFSENETQHQALLNWTLTKLTAAGLKIKPMKCRLIKDKITLVGHSVSKEGIFAELAELEAVINYPKPRMVAEVRSFVGFANYCHELLPHFSDIAKSLHELTNKNVGFEWTALCELAFNNLMQALLNPLVLAFLDWDQEFRLTTDTSDKTQGAMLEQKHGDYLVTCICVEGYTGSRDSLYYIGKRALGHRLSDQEV